MKEQLDQHREHLHPEERQRIWLRVRPAEARAHRVVTKRRWALSFGLAAFAMTLVAVIIGGRSRENVVRHPDGGEARVPMEFGVPPGPISQDQLREVALSRSSDGAVYQQRRRAGAGPFVRSADDSTSAFALVVGGDSFASAIRYLEGGNLPPPVDVRVEEFVNAFDQGYPDFEAPDLRLFIDGAPSPFGDRCQLIRVGLKARSPSSPESVEVVARAAKVQVTFDPRSVAEFRLIGFEKAGLRPDAAAAGATIAAGYEVAALYEVRLARHSKEARLLAARVRYERPAAENAPSANGAAPPEPAAAAESGRAGGDPGSIVEITASLSIGDLTPMFALAPARLRLDAAVAEFAEILRGLPWTREHRVREVLLMAEGLATEAPGSRDLNAFAELVLRAAEIREEVPRSRTGS